MSNPTDNTGDVKSPDNGGVKSPDNGGVKSTAPIDRLSAIIDMPRTTIYTGEQLREFLNKNKNKNKKVTFNVKTIREFYQRDNSTFEGLPKITDIGDITLSSDDIDKLLRLEITSGTSHDINSENNLKYGFPNNASLPIIKRVNTRPIDYTISKKGGEPIYFNATQLTLFIDKRQYSGNGEQISNPEEWEAFKGKPLDMIRLYDIDHNNIVGHPGTLYLVPRMFGRMFGGKKTRRGRKRTSRKNRKSRRRV